MLLRGRSPTASASSNRNYFGKRKEPFDRILKPLIDAKVWGCILCKDRVERKGTDNILNKILELRLMCHVLYGYRAIRI